MATEVADVNETKEGFIRGLGLLDSTMIVAGSMIGSGIFIVSADIARQLAAQRIGVGAGNFYAYRLVQALGYDTTDGLVRTSFVHYTTAAEVERLIHALEPLTA